MKKVNDVCISRSSDPCLKFEEHRKKMLFHNPSRKSCLKIQVDGCAITNGERCDSLLKVDTDEGAEYYVELKGTDVSHALEQIERTIQALHDDHSPICAYIIPTNQNPADTTKIQQYRARLKKKYNARLVIKERICETSI